MQMLLLLQLILACDQVLKFAFCILHFTDSLDSSVCPLPYNRTVNSETFRGCLDSAEMAEVRSLWLFAAGCFGGVFLVLLGELG